MEKDIEALSFEEALQELEVIVARLEAGTYFLFLDGFGGGSGTGTVDIVITPL